MPRQDPEEEGQLQAAVTVPSQESVHGGQHSKARPPELKSCSCAADSEFL